jgi:serine/threonine-protein kinase RsbW
VGETTLVHAEGRLDFGAAAGFQRELEATLAGSARKPLAVIIECTGLDYVSSAGLRALLQAARGAQRARISFALSALKPSVREVFELSGFNRLMDVHPDRATALAHVQKETGHPSARLAVPAEAAQLPSLTRSLQEFWAAATLPAAHAHAFELSLEEVFMNVVMHGSPPGSVPQVELSLALTDDAVTMTIEDDGAAFDPLSLPAPDVTSGIAERPIGGYGVFLVRQMMDTVSYQRVGARNQLRMSKRIAA